MTDLTPSRLRELLAAATPGPWKVASDAPVYAIYAGRHRVVQTPNQNNWSKCGASESWLGIESADDAALIALAPALAARVIEQDAELERLRVALAPFAVTAQAVDEMLYSEPPPDDYTVSIGHWIDGRFYAWTSIAMGDLRAARRAALKGGE